MGPGPCFAVRNSGPGQCRAHGALSRETPETQRRRQGARQELAGRAWAPCVRGPPLPTFRLRRTDGADGQGEAARRRWPPPSTMKRQWWPLLLVSSSFSANSPWEGPFQGLPSHLHTQGLVKVTRRMFLSWSGVSGAPSALPARDCVLSQSPCGAQRSAPTPGPGAPSQ